MKIVTVTANPCIDRTLKVSKLGIGGTNRVSEVTESINGKGINTSVAVSNLGCNTVAAVVEYTDGESVSTYLSALGIRHIAIPTKGKLRVNTKVTDTCSQETTEFNCAGSAVEENIEIELEKAVLSALSEGDVLVVSGSVPPNIRTALYHRLICGAKLKKAYTILDADGELLSHGLKACPDLVKPNIDELSRLCGKAIRAIDDAITESKKLIDNGVSSVCVSFGEKGALYVSDEFSYWADSIKVAAKGTVGAGDSMVAGFAIGYLNGASEKESLTSAMALAAGTISLEGSQICTAELYTQMLKQVNIKSL